MKKISISLLLVSFFMLITAQEITIIPEPQSVKYNKGEFFIPNKIELVAVDELNVNFDTTILFSLEQLKEELIDYRVSNINIYIDEGDTKNNKEDYIILKLVKNDITEKLGQQGYFLKVEKDRIVLMSSTAQGLFYGVQSIKQLIRAVAIAARTSETIIGIPCIEIIDYPDMEYRGWLDDVSRGPIPTMSYLKRQIKTLSEYKLNCMMLYVEHVFQSEYFSDVSPADGISAAQLEELQEFALKYHVEVFGNQQSFAHFENILKIPYYQKMADTEYNVNPGETFTYEFLNKILSEQLSVYKSDFFHLNCDETEGLGKGKAKDYVEENGVKEVYFEHVNKLANLVFEYDKKPIIWGDIINKDTNYIYMLDDDVIIMAWSYVAADSFETLIKPLKKNNKSFFIAPGVSCWGTLFPMMQNYKKNIAMLCRDGALANTLGMINTCWDDDGENLFNNNWHGLIWGAEMSWKTLKNSEPDKKIIDMNNRFKSFNEIFNKIFFKSDKNIVNILIYLDKIRQLNNKTDILLNAETWKSIFDFFPDIVSKDFQEFNIKVKRKIADVKAELKSIDKNIINYDVIENALIASDRATLNVDINLLRIKLYDVFTGRRSISKLELMRDVDILIDFAGQVRRDYVKMWKRENRQSGLNNVLNKFDKLGYELTEIENHVFITNTPKSGKQQVVLSTLFNDKDIVYSIDGSELTHYSTLYKSPVLLERSAILKAAVIDNKSIKKQSQQYFCVHKGLGAMKKLNSKYSTYKPAYSAGGDNGLLNGILGSKDYADGCWQGYQGQNLDIEMEFDSVIPINKVSINFINNQYNWIMPPEKIELLKSNDGQNYELLRELEIKDKENYIIQANISELNIKTKYLRVVVYNPGKLPENHHAAGNDSYIFCDEIIIE